MRRMILNLITAFLLIWAPWVFSEPGPLFNMIANGESSGNIYMTLCLNGNGPFSCQNYTVKNLNLNIKTTTPNKTYLNAGIRLNTSGYTLANTQCRPIANGFCLFSVNDQTSTNLLLTPLVLPAPPGAPTNVTATAAGDSSAKVNWTPPVDSTPVANYIITPYSLNTSTYLPATTCPNTPDFCTVNNLTNGLPYTFRVQAQNSGGESAPSNVSNQVNPPTWTQSIVDTGFPQPAFSAVSCTSSNSGGEFCMAIGFDQQSSTNFACSYINQVWSCNTVNGISIFQAVSCVNQDFCMALDLNNKTILYRGEQLLWGDPMSLGNSDLHFVSCPNINFCMAVDNSGYAYRYSNNSWGPATLVTTDPGTSLNGVSCPSSISCTAVDGGGYAYAYSPFFPGTHWSAAQYTPTSQGLTSVSCPTSSTDGFCMAGATDNNNNADAYIYTQSDPNWTSTSLGSQGIMPGLYSVSCASDQFCMAYIGGSVFNYSGDTPSWDTGNYLAYSSGLTSVSCANANFCMAVDMNGNAYIYTPAS